MDRTINQRYQIEHLLGQGGMGQVYLVRDLLDPKHPWLALKLVQLDEQKKEMLFAKLRREFQTLSDLTHPGLARVFDYGMDAESGRAFYTSEYVSGADLFTATRKLAPESTVSLLRDVCQTLEYLHTRGVFHNDLKPSNILVDPDTLTTKILDFGLSQLARPAVSPSGQDPWARAMGTPGYLAPEIIEGKPPSVQSDLFSLGMIFYKMFAGALPHAEKSLAEILQQNREARFPSPRSINSQISAALETLILELLSREPRSRPRSARDVAHRLSQKTAKSNLIPREENLRESLSLAEGSRLFGRELELAVVRKYIQTVIPAHWQSEGSTQVSMETSWTSAESSPPEGRQRGLMMVCGPEGIGKTALLSQLKKTYQMHHVPFLLVDCSQRRDLLGSWRRVVTEVSGFLGSDHGILAEYAPLRSWLDPALTTASPKDTFHDSVDLFFNLTQFLSAAFSTKPFILAFDRTENLDVDSRRYLQHLSRILAHGSRLAFPPLLLAWREMEKAREDFPATSNQWLAISALSYGACSGILEEAFFPEHPAAAFAKRLYALSGGNPALLRECLRNLILSRTLLRHDGRWNLEKLEGRKIAVPRTLRELFLRRFEECSPRQKEILRFIAIWEEPISSQTLAALLKCKVPALQADLAILSSEEIVREGAEKTWSFLQTGFAEVVREETEELPTWHRRCLEVLEKEKLPRLAQLAAHSTLAGMHEAAAGYSFAAGMQAKQLFAQETALQFFRQAHEKAKKVGKDDALTINSLSAMADLLWRQGRRKEALAAYEEVMEQTAPPAFSDERFVSRKAIALSLRDQGQLPAAVEMFEKALGDLKETELLRRAEICAQIALIALHSQDRTAAQAWSQKARTAQEEPTVAILLALFSERTGDFKAARVLYEKALSHHREHKDLRGSAIALHNLGTLCARQGDFRQGFAYLEDARKIFLQVGDGIGRCNCLLALGNLNYLRGQYCQALTMLEEALALAQGLDHRRLLSSIKTSLGQLAVDCGHFNRAKDLLDAARQLRVELHDKKGLVYTDQGYESLFLAVGDFAELKRRALRSLDQPAEPGLQITSWLNLSLARTVLGERQDALTALQQGRSLVNSDLSVDARLAFAVGATEIFLKLGELPEAQKTLQEGAALLDKSFNEVLREQYELLKRRAAFQTLGNTGEEAARKELLAEVVALQERLRRKENLSLQWQTAALQGKILESQGRLRDALIAYRHGRDVILLTAESLESKWRKLFLDESERREILEACTRLERSAQVASEELQAAQQKIADFSRFLEITQSLMLEANNRQGLPDLILDAALELVPCTRVILFLEMDGSLKVSGEKGPAVKAAPRELMEYPRAVIDDVFASGAAQRLPGTPKAGLCVPLRVKRTTLGVLFAERSAAETFDGADLLALGNLASQAGVALEIGRSYERHKETTDSLGFELNRTKALLDRQTRTLSYNFRYERLIGGRDPAMQRVFSLLDRVTNSNTSVLIEGESGTGKELVAQAIHYNGPRKDHPFVAINCAGLNPELLESELFGHRRGSFTGAEQDKEGLFSLAHDGTVFLDEIADMPAAVQAKLLRVLQEKQITPLGAKESIAVNVRIISASNRSLETLVEQGVFRQDLFFRLNVIKLDLPPLRDRPLDLDLLVEALLNEICAKQKVRKRTVTEEVRKALAVYPWPGNVRELNHVLEALVTLRPKAKKIRLEHLPAEIQAAKPKTLEHVPKLAKARELFHKQYLQDVLGLAQGNISRAARVAGIRRETLSRFLRKYKLV